MYLKDAKKRSDASKIYFNLKGDDGQLLDPSRTVQYFKDECNINAIMARYVKTGVLDHVKQFEGRYGDFSGLQGYQESLNQVIAADEMFMSLPAQIRAEFQNDAGVFLDAVDDPNQLSRFIELGLIKPKVEESTKTPSAAIAAPEHLST